MSKKAGMHIAHTHTYQREWSWRDGCATCLYSAARTPFRRRNRRRSVLLTPYYGHMHIMIPHCQVPFICISVMTHKLTYASFLCQKTSFSFSFFRVPDTIFISRVIIFMAYHNFYYIIVVLCIPPLLPTRYVYYTMHTPLAAYLIVRAPARDFRWNNFIMRAKGQEPVHKFGLMN